jgi:hypothetical protein
MHTKHVINTETTAKLSAKVSIGVIILLHPIS